MDTKTIKGKEDVCPVCGSENLSFGSWEIIDSGAVIPFECKDCGATGTEGYDLVFDGNFYDVVVPAGFKRKEGSKGSCKPE